MIKIGLKLIPDKFPDSKEVKAWYSRTFLRKADSIFQKLIDKYAAVLEPGARQNVGASGKAAKNIKAKKGTDSKGVFISVFEGTDTPANSQIRLGIKPGRWVEYGVLRKWVADKGLSLYYEPKPGNRQPNVVLDKLTSKNGVAYERSRWFGRVGIKPSSTVKPSMVAKRAIYAIRRALYNEGTNRDTANWWPLLPSGEGKYEYNRYVFDFHREEISDIVNEFGKDITSDMEIFLWRV